MLPIMAFRRRERVICVSIRKDLMNNGLHWFSFPNPIPLTKRFEDFLEAKDSINEKYYLTNECFIHMIDHDKYCKENKIGFRFKPVERAEIARTISTNANRTEVNFIDES